MKAHWKKAALGLALAIAAVALLVVYGVHRYLGTSVADAYATEWAASLVIDYMETHDGAWPNNWDDLRASYERATEAVGRPWSFQQLQERVWIDFRANPSAMVDARIDNNAPPFDVIRLHSGSDAHWTSFEPNRMIWDYLQKRRIAQQERVSTRPVPVRSR